MFVTATAIRKIAAALVLPLLAPLLVSAPAYARQYSVGQVETQAETVWTHASTQCFYVEPAGVGFSICDFQYVPSYSPRGDYNQRKHSMRVHAYGGGYWFMRGRAYDGVVVSGSYNTYNGWERYFTSVGTRNSNASFSIRLEPLREISETVYFPASGKKW